MKLDPKEWERKKEEEDRNALKEVLVSPAGRRVLYRILEHTGTFESIWDPSAKIHYNAGRQDVGHWLMIEIARADESSLAKMMQEAYIRKSKKLSPSSSSSSSYGEDIHA